MNERSSSRPVALTIAGSDSGGGAGIQADLKTFQAFGVFGTTAITAVTAQNTVSVAAILCIEPGVVRAQIDAVAEDLFPAACKSGMLADAEIIVAVAEGLEANAIPHYVLDPVMVAASGARLLEPGAVAALAARLVPLASVVTPNLDEAEMLTGIAVRDAASMRDAGERILGMGCGAVLVKGGHLESDEVEDWLVTPHGSRVWRAPKSSIGNAHGTGCTLSAAIAAGLALGADLETAVDRALGYTRAALLSAPQLGAGSRPLNHWARG